MEEPTVLFEDDFLVVVNKPSGLIVYPDGKHDYPALSAWLEKKYGEGGFHFVHRIDRETSGVLVVAKNEKTHEFLKKQFQDREVKKVYRAFVYGALRDERGTINKPIGSARGGQGPRSATRPHGTEREAVTMWRRIANGEGASYLEAFPQTGRTHQIRVHFSAIQHPIVCDTLYAPRREPLLGFKRLALHALSVAFLHPNGKTMKLEAPLPADFLAAEQKLRGA
ncbi:MAG: RluA family pseudouridine synthase [Patescibacteria group bacterium]